MQYPFCRKHRKISVTSAAKGIWRFYERSNAVIPPSISVIRRCGSSTLLNTASLLPLPLLGLAPIPYSSDFRSPSSFCAVLSTINNVEVNHFPLSTFLWSPPNSVMDPDSTSSMSVVFQECKNTWTRLWIRSIKSAPKRGSLTRALLYCRLKRAIWLGHVPIEKQIGISSPRYSPASFTKFRVKWRRSLVDASMWAPWFSSSPTSSFDRQSCPMDRMTWILIVHCWEFIGPPEYVGVRRGESPVCTSGSGMASTCPWRKV